MSTYAEQMQDIFHRFQREVASGPADLRDIAPWAIREKLWQPRASDLHDRFAQDMADALRQEYRTDEKGRNYRVNHAVRATKDGKQMSFWDDIDKAPRPHMEKAFGQRRRQIVGDCYSLRIDVDHYNDIHPEEAQIPLVLDFTDDVEEAMVANGIDDNKAA